MSIRHCEQSEAIQRAESSALDTTTGAKKLDCFGLKGLAMTCVLFLLCSCILVDDFSPKWAEGKTDICTNKIASGLYYSEFRRDPEGKDMNTLAHEVVIGGQHFLMLKQNADDKGGRMYRFTVVNGIFQRYRLNPTMKETFEHDYPNAPVSLAHDTVTLEKLGPQEVKLLADIANKPDYWEIEDQILYNTALNSLCIFEDRDLDKLRSATRRKTK